VDGSVAAVDLLFGLTGASIGLPFGAEVLVAGDDPRGLLGVALHLIRLSTHTDHSLSPVPPISHRCPRSGQSREPLTPTIRDPEETDQWLSIPAVVVIIGDVILTTIKVT